jgi:hypothetical protein
MTTVDPLAEWWVHEVTIRRWAGDGAYAPVFDAPETIAGFVHDGEKLIRNAQGQQVISSAQVALPITAAYVPVGSEIDLPMQFGHAPGDPSAPRTSTVLDSARGDGGGQPTPDHYVLALQ